MVRTTLNLGIVAHVDAGKTTLTERLLYNGGIIDAPGSVDKGTTQTDFLALERERGITIRAAVVSFCIEDVAVNLIDTPGHPDFVAEVDRVLTILDGAVLVISAVEGVQPQTRVLLRALKRCAVPTLIFVNKIDRAGADPDAVLADISRRLTTAAFPLLGVLGAGDCAAAVSGGDSLDDPIMEDLAEQTQRAVIHPLVFGSAATGAGVAELQRCIVRLLGVTRFPDQDAGPSGAVFKIERGPTGDKVAYVRMFSGHLSVRQRISGSWGDEERVTSIGVFSNGRTVRRSELRAGEIGKVTGLKNVRIGDILGQPSQQTHRSGQFGVPTCVTAVAAIDAGEKSRLRATLNQLAEQDPLINVRQDFDGEMTVSLFGEVQQEVLQATLESEYGLAVVFREATPLYVERPIGRGEAVEVLNSEANPFRATIGLRVEPGDGFGWQIAVDPRVVPLFLYNTLTNFTQHVESWVRQTLQEGLHGWPVTDVTVTMTRCTYSVPDGPPSRSGPLSTPADFKGLTPMVLMRALASAGTVVCEPVVRLRLEVPTGSLRSVITVASKAGGVIEGSSTAGEFSVLEVLLPARKAGEIQRELPALTGGEGLTEQSFASYKPVVGASPVRLRTTADPLDRVAYLASLGRSSARHRGIR